MGRLYYFLSAIAIGIIGGGAFISLIPFDALIHAQTPEAVQAALETISYGKIMGLSAILTVLFMAATYFRLDNAGMSKWLTLIMFVPVISFFFMIYLFFKPGRD